MNDKVARNMIYTLKSYITESEFEGKDKAPRLDKNTLIRWSREKSDAWKKRKEEAKALKK